MIDSTTPTPPDAAIAESAREMVDCYGHRAATEAATRAASFAQSGRWHEHDVALRLLTAVESLTAGSR